MLTDEIRKASILKETNGELKARIGALESSYYDQDQLIKSLSLQNSNLSSKNKALNVNFIEATESMIAENSNLLKRYSVNVEKLPNESLALQKENERLQTEKGKLLDEIENLRIQNDNILIDNQNLNSHIDEMGFKMKNLRQSLLHIKQVKDVSVDHLDFDTSMNVVPENLSSHSANTNKYYRLNTELFRSNCDKNISISKDSQSLNKPNALLLSRMLPRSKEMFSPLLEIKDKECQLYYRECVYMYKEKNKILVMMNVLQAQVSILDYGNLSRTIHQISIDSIVRIRKSFDHSFLNEIVYTDKFDQEVSVMLEIYQIDSFIDFLLKNSSFSSNKLSQARFRIENRPLVVKSFFNILPKDSYCGVMDIKSTSFWYDWEPIMLICSQDQLFCLALPEKFSFTNFKKHTRHVKTFKLQNFEIVEKGNEENKYGFVFQIRLVDEDDLLTFRVNSKFEFSKWLIVLNSIIDATDL